MLQSYSRRSCSILRTTVYSSTPYVMLDNVLEWNEISSHTYALATSPKHFRFNLLQHAEDWRHEAPHLKQARSWTMRYCCCDPFASQKILFNQAYFIHWWVSQLTHLLRFDPKREPVSMDRTSNTLFNQGQGMHMHPSIHHQSLPCHVSHRFVF